MKLLNLACGTLAHPDWNNVDFSFYALFRKHMTFSKIMHKLWILSADRYSNLERIDRDIIRWDLRRGIPFDNEIFHFIYCAQFIEHLRKKEVSPFLKECYRTLVTGGIIRVVTPDLERMVLNYLNALTKVKEQYNDGKLWNLYDKTLEKILDQMVRDTSVGTFNQTFPMRIIESFILGGPDTKGERHKWLYDFYSLRRELEGVGFRQVVRQKCGESRISVFAGYRLEKPQSDLPIDNNLYIEAIK